QHLYDGVAQVSQITDGSRRIGGGNWSKISVRDGRGKPLADGLCPAGVSAYRHGDASGLGVDRFANDLGMPMQPAHACSIRRVEGEFDNNPSRGKVRFYGLFERGDPLPADR